jgi:hypothetical protein
VTVRLQMDETDELLVAAMVLMKSLIQKLENIKMTFLLILFFIK